jgi:hypothetical protein
MNDKLFWEYKADAESEYIKTDKKLTVCEIDKLAKDEDWFSYRVYSS